MAFINPGGATVPVTSSGSSSFAGKKCLPGSEARSISQRVVVKATAINTNRQTESFRVRVEAAELARSRDVRDQCTNGDEYKFRDPETGKPSLIASFTKGLEHNPENGLIKDPDDFNDFVKAVDSGLRTDIERLGLGPSKLLIPSDDPHAPPQYDWRSCIAQNDGNPVLLRGWESMAAGLAFDLQGPDAQSVVMPPAPNLISDELNAEIMEVYLMALLRDVPFSKFNDSGIVRFARDSLNNLPWFNTPALPTDPPAEIARRRGLVSLENIFRGITPGTRDGPYLSQYLIRGSTQLGDPDGPNAGDQNLGRIRYGAITIDQQVRIATPRRDFMTTFEAYLDVQDAADVRTLESYEPGSRLIRTPRDLATYVHFDALYEAYLNACLILLADEVKFDPGLPFELPDFLDNQEGFTHFGSAHILSLVCEVATRALKAVRYQKFNVHRRLRPEAVGGLVHVFKVAQNNGKKILPEIKSLVSSLNPILPRVRDHNAYQNKTWPDRVKDPSASENSFLLPMAFPEGSPMHPSYGAGHAVVAGACVTILKAFFDSNATIDEVFEVGDDGTLKKRKGERLTVVGELNKIAENISIGRDWAGVHYFTDYYESILLGEEIAIGILEEQKLTFGENFSMTLPKFDGTTIRI